MIARLARRLAWAAFVVWATVSLAFLVNYALPSDPARMVAGPQARPQDVSRWLLRARLGERVVGLGIVCEKRLVRHGVNRGYGAALKTGYMSPSDDANASIRSRGADPSAGSRRGSPSGGRTGIFPARTIPRRTALTNPPAPPPRAALTAATVSFSAARSGMRV